MQRGARSQPRCSAAVVSLKAFELPTCCLTFSPQRSEISTIFVRVTRNPAYLFRFISVGYLFRKRLSASHQTPQSQMCPQHPERR